MKGGSCPPCEILNAAAAAVFPSSRRRALIRQATASPPPPHYSWLWKLQLRAGALSRQAAVAAGRGSPSLPGPSPPPARCSVARPRSEALQEQQLLTREVGQSQRQEESPREQLSHTRRRLRGRLVRLGCGGCYDLAGGAAQLLASWGAPAPTAAPGAVHRRVVLNQRSAEPAHPPAHLPISQIGGRREKVAVSGQLPSAIEDWMPRARG